MFIVTEYAALNELLLCSQFSDTLSSLLSPKEVRDIQKFWCLPSICPEPYLNTHWLDLMHLR